jgi:osmotically-inducible protein OsmY
VSFCLPAEGVVVNCLGYRSNKVSFTQGVVMESSFSRNFSRSIWPIIILIMVLLGAGFAQNSDNDLARRVLARISQYYPEDIKVYVEDQSKIRLEGEVKVLYDKLRIFDLASEVPGVKYIEDNLVLTTDKLPDNMILDNITYVLHMMDSISEPDSLKIAVDNGVVIMHGKVRFYRESIMAETMASWQQGVLGIVNEIQVEPYKEAVSDASLKGAIDDLLMYRFPLEKEISFTVSDGHVVLSGHATNLWAKTNLPKEIRRIIGVKTLENNIEVKERMHSVL